MGITTRVGVVKVHSGCEYASSDHVIEVGEVEGVTGFNGDGARWRNWEHGVDGDGDVDVREMELLDPWRSHEVSAESGNIEELAFVGTGFARTCKDGVAFMGVGKGKRRKKGFIHEDLQVWCW